MERYVAIDAGKFATKCAEYNIKKNETTKFHFATKMSEGNFKDDALEPDTYLAEIDGKVYKFGRGATGIGASLVTDKTSEIHRNSILTALATMASDKEEDEFNVATCIPASDWSDVNKREIAKEYLLPSGKFEINFRGPMDKEVKKKVFTIKQETKLCLPESIGGLFMDETPKFDELTNIGVIDIGSLNVHITKWLGVVMEKDGCDTAELGGTILARNLARQLSVAFSRCDEDLVRRILLLKPEARHLYPNNKNEETIRKSKEMIDKALLEHVQNVRNLCDAKGWPLDFMDLRFIGGTSYVLQNEIKQVFGEDAFILSNSSFCNVLGCLRSLCSRMPEIGKRIPLPFEEEKDKKVA